MIHSTGGHPGSADLQSVWLVVDVPALSNKRIGQLKIDLDNFIRNWINEAEKNTDLGPKYNDPKCEIADTKKLRIFQQEK